MVPGGLGSKFRSAKLLHSGLGFTVQFRVQGHLGFKASFRVQGFGACL